MPLRLNRSTHKPTTKQLFNSYKLFPRTISSKDFSKKESNSYALENPSFEEEDARHKSRETIQDGNPNSREYNRCVRFLITQENIITKICGVLNDIEMQSNSCCICIM